MVMQVKSDDPKKEPEVDTLFAMRMKRACDANPTIPDENSGRLVWIRDRMRDDGMDVSLQSVHRWYHGRARPRQQKLLLLAKVIGVDESWLSLGRLDEIVSRRSMPKKPVLDGAVYVIIGLMQLANLSCAWPDEDDQSAPYVHFYAIIQGQQYRFHVAYIQGQQYRFHVAYIREEGEDGSVKIHLPIQYSKCTILVCRCSSATSIDLWRPNSDIIHSNSENRGGFVEMKGVVKGSNLEVGSEVIRPVRRFESTFGVS